MKSTKQRTKKREGTQQKDKRSTTSRSLLPGRLPSPRPSLSQPTTTSKRGFPPEPCQMESVTLDTEHAREACARAKKLNHVLENAREDSGKEGDIHALASSFKIDADRCSLVSCSSVTFVAFFFRLRRAVVESDTLTKLLPNLKMLLKRAKPINILI